MSKELFLAISSRNSLRAAICQRTSKLLVVDNKWISAFFVFDLIHVVKCEKFIRDHKWQTKSEKKNWCKRNLLREISAKTSKTKSFSSQSQEVNERSPVTQTICETQSDLINGHLTISCSCVRSSLFVLSQFARSFHFLCSSPMRFGLTIFFSLLVIDSVIRQIALIM